jgi:hypothetical protein
LAVLRAYEGGPVSPGLSGADEVTGNPTEKREIAPVSVILPDEKGGGKQTRTPQ